MATITATPGIKTAFSGGDDDIVCSFSTPGKNGVQVETEGFTLNNATITAKGLSSDTGNTVSVTDAINVGIIGEGILIREVAISGVAGGSHQVTFIQL